MCSLYQAFHDFAGPVATIIAAAAAVFVTWRLGRGQLRVAEQQAKFAEVRLQHDLFERRIAVFDAARDLLLEVFRTANVSDEGFRNFVRGTEKAVFLFDKSVSNYIETMRNTAASVKFTSSRLADPDLHVGQERAQYAQTKADQTKWFFDQFDILIEKFKPALALEKDIETKIARPR